VFSPQLADYDGDGLLDLISGSGGCCHEAFGFHVFLRQKDGSFGPRQRIEAPRPESFDLLEWDSGALKGLEQRVAVADWNGDGIPDVLIGGNTRTLGVAYGPLAGKETLTVERVWPKGREPFGRMAHNPCVADWDADGLADLVVGGVREDKTRGVFWLRNVGTPREPKLGDPQLLIADEGRWTTKGLSVADWNGDGRLDLIASREERAEKTDGPQRQRIYVYVRQVR
jgi:hypothetical protein